MIKVNLRQNSLENVTSFNYQGIAASCLATLYWEDQTKVTSPSYSLLKWTKERKNTN